MADSDPPARLGSASGVPLAKVSVLIDQKLHRLLCNFGLEQTREADVTADVVRLIDSAQPRYGQIRISNLSTLSRTASVLELVP